MRCLMIRLTLCDTICHVESSGNAAPRWPDFKVGMTKTYFVIML